VRLGQSFPILQRKITPDQSFSASEQPSAKLPWCMQQKDSPDESSGVAMQGDLRA